MKKLILMLVCMIPMMCGCDVTDEPNEIAYITAIGIDTAQDNDYTFTIQFARPVQISGGTEGSSGENIMENITIKSPSLFSAINMANQLVSKRFDLSHAKLIVISEQIAQDGVNELIQVMSRNSQIRPNIYFAVSTCSAREYLEAVKPMLEINPVKYYELIFENYNSIYSPNSLAHRFYFSESSLYADGVLPLTGILPEYDDENDSSSDSGSEDDKYFGTHTSLSSENTDFSYMIPNYLPGDFPEKTHIKSEVVGMALFHDHKMIGKMGSIDCEMYNILSGEFVSSYIPYKISGNDVAVTLKIQQNKKPVVKVDTSGENVRIKINVQLEGEIVSVPYNYSEIENMRLINDEAEKATKDALMDFLYRTSRVYGSDICEFGGYAKRSFMTNRSFEEYDWSEKYKTAEFDVNVFLSIRRTGLIISTDQNIVE